MGTAICGSPDCRGCTSCSDSVITLSYYSIPIALVWFVQKRRDVPFNWMFWLFAEVLDPRQVKTVAEHADVLQVGARHMQNFPLLCEVARVRRPVLLKRGLSATITELLLAAEYVLSHGTAEAILCERGIRTFETATSNTLDIAAIPVLRRESHLPVIVDPSHAAGRADLVAPLAYAAVVAGATGSSPKCIRAPRLRGQTASNPSRLSSSAP